MGVMRGSLYFQQPLQSFFSGLRRRRYFSTVLLWGIRISSTVTATSISHWRMAVVYLMAPYSFFHFHRTGEGVRKEDARDRKHILRDLYYTHHWF